MCFFRVSPLLAQAGSGKDYRNFPIIVTVQFHGLALPFHDMKSNFSNIGLGLGTEVSLNGNHDWAQQFSVVWYRNKAIGNGLFLYTQSTWRPTIVSNSYTELKAGAGYLISFRPVKSYKQVNGDWIPVGRKGKGLFAVPVGISSGYNNYSSDAYLSPFVSYQFLIVKDYNNSMPIVPETLIQVGTRIHPNYEY